MHNCNKWNCQHEHIAFCHVCNKPYCVDCGKEWVEEQNYSWTYYPSTIYGTSCACSDTTKISKTTCCHKLEQK